jgi:2-dehydro-3-deoxyphosphogluconate aldolase/(4S)-4-hydroxy-2-oxoglutarate aldolase
MTDLPAHLAATRLLPVVVIDRPADAEPLSDALVSGGLPSAEVTLRTETALEALRIMAEREDLVVGAGTVVRPDQVTAAVAAGARYVVSPGFSAAVVRECAQQDVPCIPGVATATEILCAVDHGIDVVKFFPAEAAGGARAVQALAGPFAQVRFVPTGGVTAEMLGAYLALPQVLAVGGSWMVAPHLIAAGRFERIAELTREAVALAGSTREATAS